MLSPETLVELFGYLGSVLVVVSMLMASVVKLRVINTVGSIISGAYALIIGSFPLALMNFCLIVINLYNLRRLLLTRQHYDLVKCAPGDAFLHYFLQHYREDIALYFPRFFREERSPEIAYLLFANGDPAGILLGRAEGEQAIRVQIEYTTPTYRDCSIGKFLYSALPNEGVTRLLVSEAAPQHRSYLEKMGYQSREDGFVKTLG